MARAFFVRASARPCAEPMRDPESAVWRLWAEADVNLVIAKDRAWWQPQTLSHSGRECYCGFISQTRHSASILWTFFLEP
jgi:hypothetical protein